MAAKRSRGAVKPTVNLKCVLFEWNDSEEAMTKFADLADELGTDIYHFVPIASRNGTRFRTQRTGQGAVRFVEADAA